MIQRNYILFDDDKIERVFGRVREAAKMINRRTGRRFTYSHTQDRGPDVKIHGWRDENEGRSSIDLVDDQQIPARYLQVEANEQDEGIIAQTLGEELSLATVSQLQERARAAKNADGAALARLGLGSPPDFDPVTFEILKAGLAAEDRAVRFGATLAIFLLKWPSFAPAIKAAIEVETDEELGRVLDAALEATGPDGS